MGQEIVYCYKCLSRLVSSDFDRAQAFRVGDRYSCAQCVQELLASLPDDERQEILEGKGRRPGSSASLPALRSKGDSSSQIKRLPPRPASTTRLRHADAPPPKKSNLPLILGGAGGAVAVIVAAVALMLSGKPPPEIPKPPPPPDSGSTPRTTPSDAAKKALDEAAAYGAQNAADLSGRMKRALDAIRACSGTPHLRAAEELRTKILETAADEFREIDKVAGEFFAKDLARGAIDHLDQFRSRYEFPEWTKPIADRRAHFTTTIDSRYQAGLAKAREERKRGNEEEAKKFSELVARWGLTDYIARLKNELPAPETAKPEKPPDTPVEKAASKALVEYRERWKKAVELAQARDFGAAIGALEAARKGLQDEEAAREADEDLKAFRLAAALHDDALKAAAELPRWTRVKLEVLESPKRRTVEGAVLRADARRLRILGEDGSVALVELPSIFSWSLAELALAHRKAPAETDRAAAGYLSILEGHDGAAERQFGGRETAAAKYWMIGESGGPKTDPKELEARRLFHAAETEWASPKTRGAAIEKYRQFLSEHAATRIGGQEAAAVAGRAAAGKEYVLLPADLRAAGQFRPAKHPPKIDAALTSQKDAEAEGNHVEAEFHALPDTSYRAWAWVGACCRETFLFYLMTTEGTTSDKGKEVSIDPAAGRAAPVEPSISGLAPTHAKDKEKAKAPRHWTWVPIPLPRKYAAPGPKTIRLLSDHQGFSVAALVVSSTRTRAPTETEWKELAKDAAARPAEARGAAEPSWWLLCGPLESGGIDGAHPPESGIDLNREIPGKGGPAKWRLAAAALEPAGAGRTARFNYRTMYGAHDNAIVYALIHVKAPAAMTVKAKLGSDDGIKAWCNGAVFHRNDASRAAKADDDDATVKLEAGWNRLLFKVRNGNGDFGFCGRLSTPDGKPVEGLEYDPYGDLEGAPR